MYKIKAHFQYKFLADSACSTQNISALSDYYMCHNTPSAPTNNMGYGVPTMMYEWLSS